MLVTQFDKFVNRSTQQILSSPIERENLVPMLSTDIPPIPPKLQNIKVTENGIYYPESGYDGFYEVDVDIPTNLQNITITENGTYYPSEGYDGVYEINVEVGDEPHNIPQSFINYCNYRYNHPTPPNSEYQANIYGNTKFINATGAVLIGNFSNGGSATGNVLSQSLTNFSCVALQGIYQSQKTSSYNTSMLYWYYSYNVEYWSGMKDRNKTYSCYVKFIDETHCNLRGNMQVLIYGLP